MKKKKRADVAIRIYKESRKQLKIWAIRNNTTIAGQVAIMVNNVKNS